jgi:hypothetical protein
VHNLFEVGKELVNGHLSFHCVTAAAKNDLVISVVSPSPAPWVDVIYGKSSIKSTEETLLFKLELGSEVIDRVGVLHLQVRYRYIIAN